MKIKMMNNYIVVKEYIPEQAVNLPGENRKDGKEKFAEVIHGSDTLPAGTHIIFSPWFGEKNKWPDGKEYTVLPEDAVHGVVYGTE